MFDQQVTRSAEIYHPNINRMNLFGGKELGAVLEEGWQHIGTQAD